MDQVSNVLAELEKAEYKGSKEKSKFLKEKVNCLGFRITKNGMTPLREKTEAIRKLNPRKALRRFDHFSDQYKT